MSKMRRYPGSRPFPPEYKELFFGRGQDINALTEAIKAKQMIVVSGVSGLGKSSLLNAGVIPKFGDEYPVIPVRFHRAGSLSDSPAQSIVSSISTDRCIKLDF